RARHDERRDLASLLDRAPRRPDRRARRRRHHRARQPRRTHRRRRRVRAHVPPAVRGVRRVIALAWRSARGVLLATLALTTLGARASAAYTPASPTVTAAAPAHDSSRLIEGAVLIAVLFTVSWAFGTLGASTGSILTDRLNLEIGARIGELTA